MTRQKNNISLKDIAEYCQVSIMTVSRAFRRDSVINPETRSRILHAAEILQYNCQSRRGRPQNERVTTSGQTVQMIFGTIDGNISYFHMRLLMAVEQQLALLGYECIIRTAGNDYNIFVRLLDNARHHKCAATLILGNFMPEQLNALLVALPGAMLLDNAAEETFDGIYSSFSFDNRKAGRIGVEHLVRECGCKRILFITGFKNHFFTRELLEGCKEALADCGIPFCEELVVQADYSAESAALVLKEVIEKQIPFDAVFTNDEMATGVYRVLNEMNLKIPEDVAVCGCDDLPVGKQLYPELTSISLDYSELARYALEHVTAGNGHLTNAVHVTLPPVLRPGRSTVRKIQL